MSASATQGGHKKQHWVISA